MRKPVWVIEVQYPRPSKPCVCGTPSTPKKKPTSVPKTRSAIPAGMSGFSSTCQPKEDGMIVDLGRWNELHEIHTRLDRAQIAAFQTPAEDGESITVEQHEDLCECIKCELRKAFYELDFLMGDILADNKPTVPPIPTGTSAASQLDD